MSVFVKNCWMMTNVLYQFFFFIDCDIFCGVSSFLQKGGGAGHQCVSRSSTMVIPLSISLFFSLVALGGSQPSAELLSSLIPARFPNRDLSRYTIRYLSQSSSSADSEACLQPQPPQGEANSTLQSCSTIRYSLSGGERSGTTFYNTSYLILVVSPGRYPYNGTIKLIDFSNIIIAKNPLEADEAVFMCHSKHSRIYNNLFFEGAENIALLGMTFSNCGPLSTGITIRDADNTVINSCIFKYVSHLNYSREPEP